MSNDTAYDDKSAACAMTRASRTCVVWSLLFACCVVHVLLVVSPVDTLHPVRSVC